MKFRLCTFQIHHFKRLQYFENATFPMTSKFKLSIKKERKTEKIRLYIQTLCMRAVRDLTQDYLSLRCSKMQYAPKSHVMALKVYRQSSKITHLLKKKSAHTEPDWIKFEYSFMIAF